MAFMTQTEKGAHDMQIEERRKHPDANCSNCTDGVKLPYGQYMCGRIEDERKSIEAAWHVMNAEPCFRWRNWS